MTSSTVSTRVALRDSDKDERWLNVDLQAVLKQFAHYHDNPEEAPALYRRTMEDLDKFADSHMDRHRHVEITDSIYSVPYVGHDNIVCLTRGQYARTDLEQTAIEEFLHGPGLGRNPAIHELPLRVHLELSSIFAFRARHHDLQTAPEPSLYNLFGIESQVILDRYKAAMALLWETNNASLARQERNCMLAIVPVTARHVQAHPVDHKIDPDTIVGAMTLVPAYSTSLHEFARPYRMPAGDERVPCAHIPHTVLTHIAAQMIGQLNKIHDIGRVVGNIGPHTIAYFPDQKGADALHMLSSDPLHRARNDAYTEHAMNMITPQSSSGSWEWNFVGLESASPASERPVHYCAHTVSPFFGVRPQDLEEAPCAQDYFRVLNILNDYEALVHTLAKLGRSYHDKRRLQGMEEGLAYHPVRASRQHLWFSKLSMAYYPPWCSVMLWRIDNERECLYHMPWTEVCSWTQHSLVLQLLNVLDSGPFGPNHYNSYILRDCCNPEKQGIDTSVSRFLGHVDDDPYTDAATAWTNVHGNERTDSGQFVFERVMRRLRTWIPDWDEVQRAVHKLNSVYLYVPGTVTSTYLPRIIEVDLFRRDISDRKQWPHDTMAKYFGNASEIVEAHEYAFRLHLALLDLSTHVAAIVRLSGAHLAQLIATAEETMQVLVDAIDSSHYNIDSVPFRTYLLVLAVDEALHRVVQSVLDKCGESVLTTARAIIDDERCVHHAHNPIYIQFISDQLARLVALTMMRLKRNTHSEQAARLLQHSDTALDMSDDVSLLQIHSDIISNTVRSRVEQPGGGMDERPALPHEAMARRHIGKMTVFDNKSATPDLSNTHNVFASLVRVAHTVGAVDSDDLDDLADPTLAIDMPIINTDSNMTTLDGQ